MHTHGNEADGSDKRPKPKYENMLFSRDFIETNFLYVCTS
jgi:hypothetical protein